MILFIDDNSGGSCNNSDNISNDNNNDKNSNCYNNKGDNSSLMLYSSLNTGLIENSVS